MLNLECQGTVLEGVRIGVVILLVVVDFLVYIRGILG